MKGEKETPGAYDLLQRLFKPHPWHAVPIGDDAPERVTTYIELVPSDTVKYEIDKASGYLKVDRPQKYSSVCPSLYGFIPQTYCGERTARLTREATGRDGLKGDQDPLDICVLTVNPFTHGDFIADAIPIGGFRMLDHDEADDKILAVLKGDVAYSDWHDIDDVPAAQLKRLEHYFLTYKQPPQVAREPDEAEVEIVEVYGRDTALEVITASREDYLDEFPDLAERLSELLVGTGGEG